MRMIEDKPVELGFPLGMRCRGAFPHPHLPTYILRFFIFFVMAIFSFIFFFLFWMFFFVFDIFCVFNFFFLFFNISTCF